MKDTECIAALCDQLGYPTSPEVVRRRLEEIQRDNDHVVHVAELADGRVSGWVHAYLRRLVVADPHAEIGGLVVDKTDRGMGIGRLLMQKAEQWARERGCQGVRVRSNIVREGAHAFYENLGYANVKSQHVFNKIL